MNMKYPRVIIIGETFRLNGGGGITMTNLFKDWPGNNIAVITDRIDETNPDTPYSFYQLGKEEIEFPFPFSLIQKKFRSGNYNFEPNKSNSVVLEDTEKKRLGFKRRLRPLFDKFLKYSGLNSFFYTIRISNVLKEWIIGFKPDIIYIQPFHHNIIRFGNLIYEKLGIPYAIHVMDDSVRYINKSKIFKNSFQRLIEGDFKKLIDNAEVRMCISEAMAEEYFSRYNKPFLHFRNPIETEHWLPFQKKNFTIDSGLAKIIYTGRLFPPTLSSLIDLCRVIDKLNRDDKKVVLEIYTHDKNQSFFELAASLKGIVFRAPVLPGEMPALIQKYDIFFLCLDFDGESRKYSQFSISTRTSEGMISGVPVLMYAPENSAQYKYFQKTDSGCLVGLKNLDALESSLLKICNDSEFRQHISRNAVKTALVDSDARVVREKFRNVLTN